jgi:predicted membrane channel-forming protein YqfA (hemolysin III family)
LGSWTSSADCMSPTNSFYVHVPKPLSYCIIVAGSGEAQCIQQLMMRTCASPFAEDFIETISMVRSHKKSATAQLWRHCKSSIFPAPRDCLLLLLLLPTSEVFEVWVLLWIQRRASIFFMLFFCWSKRWEVEALGVLKRFDKERILVLILSSFLPFLQVLEGQFFHW